MTCWNMYQQSTLHIYTLNRWALILKLVSFHDFPLRAPLADQAANPSEEALRDKFWRETIFKIIAGRINVSVCNVQQSEGRTRVFERWGFKWNILSRKIVIISSKLFIQIIFLLNFFNKIALTLIQKDLYRYFM